MRLLLFIARKTIHLNEIMNTEMNICRCTLKMRIRRDDFGENSVKRNGQNRDRGDKKNHNTRSNIFLYNLDNYVRRECLSLSYNVYKSLPTSQCGEHKGANVLSSRLIVTVLVNAFTDAFFTDKYGLCPAFI